MCVLLEYWPYGLIRAGFRPEELIETLLGVGLHVCRVADDGQLVAVDPSQVQGLCGVGRGTYINLVAAYPDRMAALIAEPPPMR